LNINVLINNASHGQIGHSINLGGHNQDSLPTLNIYTLKALGQLFGAKMKQRGQGHILYTVANTGHPSVSANENYIRLYTDSLREEMLPFGVKVSGYFPKTGGNTSSNFFGKNSPN
jgi:short-subunit dehydrogenase